MAHIFVSYAHTDRDFANNLIRQLKRAEFEVWVDHEELHAGVDWRTEIDNAIRDASSMILIVTPEAKMAEYVTYEWAFALGVGLQVIPVLLRPTVLHPRLEAMQFLDFTDRTARPWGKLTEWLKETIATQTRTKLKNTQRVAQTRLVRLRKIVKQDGDLTSRNSAIRELGILKDDESIPLLVNILEKSDGQYYGTRTVAAEALGDIGSKDAISALLRAMQKYGGPNGYHDKFLYAIVRALGQIADVSTLPVLIAQLKECKREWKNGSYDEYRKMHRKLGEVIALALSSFDSPEAVVALNAWRED